MTDEQFQDFITAVKRGSLLALGNVLPIEGMTAGQLKTLYVEIGKHYLNTLLTTPFMPRVDELVSRYEP